MTLSGHVGAPLPCAMVKVVDITEMNYLAKNGEGEVRCKCVQCFSSGSWTNCAMLGAVRFVFAARVCSEAT